MTVKLSEFAAMEHCIGEREVVRQVCGLGACSGCLLQDIAEGDLCLQPTPVYRGLERLSNGCQDLLVWNC